MSFVARLRGHYAGTPSTSDVPDDQFVRFTNVDKSFDGETLVIKKLNLDVHRGEFLTLLGPSGSGKTTTLLLLAGFQLATRGDVLLAGRSLRNVPPNKRDIGMVFQSYALFPHMTIYENLAFPLVARKTPAEEIKRRVGQALEMVHLTGFDRRRPSELSGGQQQRVAVARALIFEPSLVLLDEPLGALDRQLREQMQIELKHIHESVGVTMIYVTHDQEEALFMSDRIAVFNEGRIEQLASPRVLYREPQNSFVANFLGESNVLSGTVVEIDGPRCTVEIDGGGHVQALAINIDGIGSRTNVSVRSEDMKLSPRENTYPNQFEARVEEVIYLGDHMRVRVNLRGSDFVINVPGGNSASWDESPEVITVGWACDDCRALDAT